MDREEHIQVPASVLLNLVHTVKHQSVPDVQRGDPPLQGLTGRTQVGLKAILGAGREGSRCRREALVVEGEFRQEVTAGEKQRESQTAAAGRSSAGCWTQLCWLLPCTNAEDRPRKARARAGGQTSLSLGPSVMWGWSLGKRGDWHHFTRSSLRRRQGCSRRDVGEKAKKEAPQEGG